MFPSHLLITATKSGGGYRVIVSTSSDTLPIAEFTCALEDMPAQVDAHLVGLIGMVR